MHIAILTDGIYPYVVGGMQKHSADLVRYLLRRGHKIDLYHTKGSNGNAATLDCFTTEEKAQLNSILLSFPDMGSAPGHYIRESYSYSVEIAKEMKKRPSPDFIIAKGFTAWELINRKTKGEKFPPIAVNFHGYEMFQAPASWKEALKQRFIFRSPALFCIRNSDYVFSYGLRITDLLKSLNVESNRIIEIPGAIRGNEIVDAHVPVKAPLKFIFAGRFERRKGIQELIQVLTKLVKTNTSQFQFTFAGPVPAKLRLKGDNFHYTGEIKDPDRMRELFRRSDIAVCPSHSEGMPNVVLEAMAAGCAVIATDTGATGLMVQNDNGWLIQPADTDALERAMREALNISSDSLNRMKQVSLIRVRSKFTWEYIAEQTEQRISMLISEQRQ